MDTLSKAIPAIAPILAEAPLRQALRAATQDAHERLHHHPGLASLQAGTLTLGQYRALLARLYGFYAPVEHQAGLTPYRTQWLQSDLVALGLPPSAVPSLPICPALPRGVTAAGRLGLRYVIEGASLGGQLLARSLDALLAAQPGAGRAFFTGFGPDTGAHWRGLLGELALVPQGGPEATALIDGARETFAIFEGWLSDWEAV